KPRMRFLIAVHRKQGESIDEIAQACEVTRSTIAAVLQRFQERGATAGLKPR
ncbi:helix-turn-helix domain-containing protein, partial [Candidatus Micrarchaeota archaeon]|nr:helix-turn-helix domain-containing protein [Candidatus Micrarchaeota archaeon]